MGCRIDGNTIKLGLTNFLDKQLNSSDIFEKSGAMYVAKPTQYFVAQDFVKGINTRFSQDVITKRSDSSYSIAIPDDVLRDYLVSTQEGKDLYRIVGLYGDFAYSPDSWNDQEAFSALNYPEVNEFTYNKLVDFILSLNPKMRVEEVADLSTEGYTNVKDFLVQVRTASRFSAITEEAAHIFRLMLPDDHPLKKQMFENITSFEIYRQTLARYKDIYLKDDGTPDYDKIKWEAADKLVSEYITALATGDTARIDALARPAKGWMPKWLADFIEWLAHGIIDHTNAYADIAGLILSGRTDTTLKNDKELADISFTDSYFYKTDNKNLYTDHKLLYGYANQIVALKPPLLLDNISKFSKEFSRKFNEILKDEKFKELNDILKTDGNTIGKINKLSEIQVLLKDANLDLEESLESNAYITAVKQYLEAIDRLKILTDGLIKVINNKQKSKDFDEAINNIKELETYFGLYQTFRNMISVEFTKILMDSGVPDDILTWLNETQASFKTVNDYILDKQRHNLFVFYKGLLLTSNNAVHKTLLEDIERAEKQGFQKGVEMFKKQLKELVVSDEQIMQMVSGRGKDIDNFSTVNHLINAAYTNGDPYLAGIATYVKRKIEGFQIKADVEMHNILAQVDPLQKALNETAVTTGKAITFLDNIWDNDLGETRQVLTWMNPHKNIYPVLEEHRRKVRTLGRARYEADKNSPEYKTIDEEYRKASDERNLFLDTYFNRPFKKEYYTFRKKYENNQDFLDVMTEWQNLSEIIKNDEDFLQFDPENQDVASDVVRTKRLRASLLNEFDEYGDPKSEGEVRQAKILKQFFEESASFKEEDTVQTDRSYNIARNRYQQRVDYAINETEKKDFNTIEAVEKSIQALLNDTRIRIVTIYNEQITGKNKIDYDFIKDVIMEKWAIKNETRERNDAFYEEEARIRAELDDLQKKGELTDVDLAIKKAYEDLRSVLFGSRDQAGHVNPDSLIITLVDDKGNKVGEDRSLLDKLIELEEVISDLKDERPGFGVHLEDFTPAHRKRWEDLTKEIDDLTLDAGRRRRAKAARGRIASIYKNKGTSKKIRDLINLLGSMTTKTATNYYWDKMITFIPHIAEFGKDINSLDIPKEDKVDINNFVKDFIDSIDREDWDRLDFHIYEHGYFKKQFLPWLRDNKLGLYNWFLDNHTEKLVFDNQNNTYTKIQYARSVAYTYIEPTEERFTDVKKSRRFRKTRVKDEFRTGYNPKSKKVELQVGVHISNREYNGFPEFLPLLPEQGAPANSPYKNEAYYALRDSNPLRFKYLTALRDAHIKFQSMLPSRLRSWNQAPVMQLSEIEGFQKIPDKAQETWDMVKSVWTKGKKDAAGNVIAGTEGDAEAEAKGEDTTKEIDQFTQTTIMDRIPKLGMSQKIPVERVSRDLLRSVEQFILRAHEFEGRSQAEPVVKALIRVMKSNSEQGYLSNKERAKKFEDIYSQMILQEVPETTLNSKAVRRLAKFITGNTALRMLADPIGGIINYASAMINDVIEASAGKYLNFNDLARGKMLAYRVNMNLMADYNKKANLSVDTLMFQRFDFIQGDFEDDLLDRSSSMNKHAQVQQLLMIPRKSGELVAQIAIAMGILERNKIVNKIDGKKYSIHEIYKKEGNNLALKEGFWEFKKDKDGKDTTEKIYPWNPVDGALFLKMRETIHRVNLELHGNYSKLTQSEASRYALGKLAENMKRWFMPAFQRRFGRLSVDITYEDLNEGYYRTAFNASKNIFGSLFRLDFGGAQSWGNLFLKTPRYQQNLRRVGTEIAQAAILFFIFAIMLGYSGDDKNKELENNSWIHNTAILIAFRVYSETTAYIPIPPFGFQEMKRNALTPFSLPSDAISNMMAVAQLGLYQVLYWMGADGLEDQLYYKKDSGYWYSDKGDGKLWKYVLNTFGHSGYTVNPDQYIRQFSNIQGRLK